MVQFSERSFSGEWGPRFTDVYAVAIREGGVAEMFSLHKKTKVSIEQEGDVAELIAKGVKRLSVLRDAPGVKSIFWEECYPEPMKQKDLLAEIDLSNSNHRRDMTNLAISAEAWQLDHNTVAAPSMSARARL